LKSVFVIFLKPTVLKSATYLLWKSLRLGFCLVNFLWHLRYTAKQHLFFLFWNSHSPKIFKKQSDKSGNIIIVARKSKRLPFKKRKKEKKKTMWNEVCYESIVIWNEIFKENFISIRILVGVKMRMQMRLLIIFTFAST
jgi:hypothetical protein